MNHRKKKEEHRSLKCLKYVTRNDRPRLKSYMKKHRLDVNVPRLNADDTLLHVASRLGHDEIVRYLLKKGADCLLMNARGDLPIHLAVQYALGGHKHAYTDLVLPLIKHAPSSLDQPNAGGQTCRNLLQQYKATLVSDSKDSDTESSQSEDHQDARDWNKRLTDELADEYAEQYGAYELDDYYTEEEHKSWDEWASRIHSDHHTRRQHVYNHLPSSANTHKRPANGNTHPPKHSKISDEKRKAFEENMKKDYQEQQNELARVRSIMTRKSLEIYKVMCAYLFDNDAESAISDRILAEASEERSKMLRKKFSVLKSKSNLLGFNDIPWPVKADEKFKYRWGFTDDLVVEFLLADIRVHSDDYLQCLKMEQRRWHPDRFLQKCGSRLKDDERDKIIESVTKISQIFNKLLHDRK